MPRELVAIAPRTPVLRDYDEPPLGPTAIRIRTELASPKHGTELVGYRNDPVASRPYDPDWGAVMPRPPEETLATFPRPRPAGSPQPARHPASRLDHRLANRCHSTSLPAPADRTVADADPTARRGGGTGVMCFRREQRQHSAPFRAHRARSAVVTAVRRDACVGNGAMWLSRHPA